MSELSLAPPPVAPEFCVISRTNASLDRRRRWSAFALLASVSLMVALVFAIVGAWPVLPFSILELACLGIAFAVVERRARDWERLTVCGDRVIVERERRGDHQTREFNRRWLQVEIGERGFAHEPHLTLRFAGETLDFGEALPPGRRIEVARALRRLTSAR